MTRPVVIAAAVLAAVASCADPGAPTAPTAASSPAPAAPPPASTPAAASALPPGAPFAVPPSALYLALADTTFQAAELPPSYGTPRPATPPLDDGERADGMYGEVQVAAEGPEGSATIAYLVFRSRGHAERAFRIYTDVADGAHVARRSIDTAVFAYIDTATVEGDLGRCVATHADEAARVDVRCYLLANPRWPVVMTARLDEPYDTDLARPPAPATRERGSALVQAARRHWERVSLALAARGGRPADESDARPTARADDRDAAPAPAAPTPQAAAAPSRCDRVAGQWSWLTGGVVTFSADALAAWDPPAASPLPSVTGTWSCDPASGATVVRWSHGSVDDLALAANGDRLEGTTRGQGTAVTGTRVR